MRTSLRSKGTKMSEQEVYFEDCQRGMFADHDASQCGCAGAGWFLSQLDTWHQCPVHYAGQPSPESNEYDLSESKPAAPNSDHAAAEADDSDIPF